MAHQDTKLRALFQKGRIGPVELRNRFVRAGTSEGMVVGCGTPTEDLVNLYEDLARNNVGLIITGHMFVDRRGQYDIDQVAIDRDSVIGPLQRLTDAVHQHGGKVFAQLGHAGSQSVIAGNRPVAPSSIPNVMTGRNMPAATSEDIEATIDAFGAAARRAVDAGFDGVHIHGANGYLISEFSSPVSNRRQDEWGGTSEGRDRLVLEIAKRVRAETPSSCAVTIKVGLVDLLEGGLGLNESLPRAERLVAVGVDGIEVSCNLLKTYTDNLVPYVAVHRGRAITDLLPHRVLKTPPAEAYYRHLARALRSRVTVPLILVGGLRSTATMVDVIESRDADFIALARPFIREPDLVRRIERGRQGLVECTSCNICLMHAGHHPLQCWRTPRSRLVRHAFYRLKGGFRSGRGGGQKPKAPRDQP